MTYLAEMSLAERKALSKEELRDQLNREEMYDCSVLHQEFKPISDERLEETYNGIQAEKDDPDENKRGFLRAEMFAVLNAADEKKLSITDTLDAIKAAIILDQKLQRL